MVGVVVNQIEHFKHWCYRRQIKMTCYNKICDKYGEEYVPIIKIDDIRGRTFNSIEHVYDYDFYLTNDKYDLYQQAKTRIKR